MVLQHALIAHSCGKLLWDTLGGQSRGRLLWDIHAGHSCTAPLQNTLAGHCGSHSWKALCRKLWWDTLVGNVVKHCCRDTFVGQWDPLVGHSRTRLLLVGHSCKIHTTQRQRVSPEPLNNCTPIPMARRQTPAPKVATSRFLAPATQIATSTSNTHKLCHSSKTGTTPPVWKDSTVCCSIFPQTCHENRVSI